VLVNATANYRMLDLVGPDVKADASSIQPGTQVQIVQLSPNRTLVRLFRERRMRSIIRFDFPALPKEYPVDLENLTPEQAEYIAALSPDEAQNLNDLKILIEAKEAYQKLLINAGKNSQSRSTVSRTPQPKEDKLTDEGRGRRARIFRSEPPTVRFMPSQVRPASWTTNAYRQGTLTRRP
jgi:hypothetical protein